MDCTKIRDLIITDYIDNEGAEAVRDEVRQHLKACAGCRGFEQELRERVSEPLRNLEPETPPESIWQGVRERIEEEQAAASPSLLQRIVDFLAGAFAVRKPAVAFSAAFAILFVSAAVLFPLYRQWTVKQYLLEQSDAMHSMTISSNGETEKDTGFGTDIEQVFLGELS